MAERKSQASLITLRDNYFTAYTTISTSPTASYTMGDRTFSYVDLDTLWKQVTTLDRQILMLSTTYKAYGKNRADFESWN